MQSIGGLHQQASQQAPQSGQTERPPVPGRPQMHHSRQQTPLSPFEPVQNDPNRPLGQFRPVQHQVSIFVSTGVMALAFIQGDQIGRIFAHWVTHYIGYFCENYRNSTYIWSTFFHSKSCLLIFTKMDWATFWATFSQTHLVTLHSSFLSLND
jgi:hypothetical protein